MAEIRSAIDAGTFPELVARFRADRGRLAAESA
jgi:queuine/archaeosine tRNA-ribosyltransferase